LDFARSVEGIVLVDGLRLSGLMIDHEIGVNARVLRIPKIDTAMHQSRLCSIYVFLPGSLRPGDGER